MGINHLTVGTTLQGGKYKIVRFLSSGGFGCTYEAEHTQLQSHVALKEFFVGDFCNRNERTGEVSLATQTKAELLGKLRKKFIEEARAVFQMHHQHIVRVLDIFEENGTAYYAMDYIDGQSLHEIVKHRGKLPEGEAVKYILQIADALKYVHSLNRLHLDVKPGNIMVDSGGNAILIDFGASKHYDDESGENTSTLLGVNTKGYAPVELMNSSFSSFNPSADIYSLGATLYKLLTGITPPSSLSLLSDDEELKPLPTKISKNVRDAVGKAMQLKRNDRPQSVDEFLSSLNSAEQINTAPPIHGDETVLYVKVDGSEQNVEKQIQQPVLSKDAKTDYKEKGSSNRWLWIGGLIITLFVVAMWYSFSPSSTPISEFEKEKDLANQGDANAQFILGCMYYDGDGVEQDYVEAVKWFRKSAEQGDADAQYGLGYCYKVGCGVEQDYIEAVKWFRKSAEQGDARAQCYLGWCYENGEGVEQDNNEAVKLYRKSAEQGNAVAQCNLGWCYENGEGVEQDFGEAVKWYRKAAEQGNAYAQCNLGVCYENGEGVEQDNNKAVKLYRKSAEQGNAVAQCNLGYCYLNGSGVEQDYGEAVRWYRKSAEQGYARAQCNLGWCYENSYGVEQDNKEAIKWYKLAADQGYEYAQEALKRLQ